MYYLQEGICIPTGGCMTNLSSVSTYVEESEKKSWFENTDVFIPPPGFVNLNGPTYQRDKGMVRGVPTKFSRGVQIIGTYHLGFLGHVKNRSPTKNVEMERFIRVGTCPDGYGNLCLLFQCIESEEKSIWMCLKPEKE